MEINDILRSVRDGSLSPDEAERLIKYRPFDDLGYAMVDHHREIRQGIPEVIFCGGKTPAQVRGIVENMLAREAERILGTHASAEIFEQARLAAPNAAFHPAARVFTVGAGKTPKAGKILVAAAGTSDLPVAEEAAVTADFFGNGVERAYDVGVAGLHRLLSKLDAIGQADVIIVTAGMEGALASVIGGLTDMPVIAVPTSVGYGANFHGLSALLAMLNCCASGVGVVNIDNGFGAACLANRVIRMAEKFKRRS
ncbi:MAG: nickel pincer cofactor biosynthesis protein LarB [Synergistaceae bacterium]|nr:nickel pincer cofactor biosynthesis protein LarB [Synergistaceae bacterium]